jgi:hypothetical protein
VADANITLTFDMTEVTAAIAEAVAKVAADEAQWRKAIADQVRANCTLDWATMQKGGDAIVYGVCDWIENPPEWSQFNHRSIGIR